MKALISIKESDCSWVRKILAQSHPAMVAIANKPHAEYLLDFAILNGCSEIRMVMDEPGGDLEDYFGDGSRWGVRISYGVSHGNDSLEQVLEKNSLFCNDSALLIMDGFFFIHYDKNSSYDIRLDDLSQAKAVSCQSGSVIYCRSVSSITSISAITANVDFSLSPLTSMDDVFQISIQVLDAEQQHYVLPGYGPDAGVLMGRNVEMEKGVHVIPPVIIGSNVRLGSGSVIGPHTAIGSDSVVDDGTIVKESVIFAKSYLGRHLTLQRKIICGDRMLSVKDGEWLEIRDEFLLSKIRRQRLMPIFRKLLDRAAALFLIFLSAVPFYFLSSVRRLQGDWKTIEKVYFTNAQGEWARTREIEPSRNTLSGRTFERLSLDCFYKLFCVVAGRLDLVGNQPIEASEENRNILLDFSTYSAGVFTYSKAEKVAADSLEADVTERFYSAKRSIIQDYNIIEKNLQAGFRMTNMEAKK